MATLARVDSREQSFWQKMMLGIALFSVFAFAQFSLRGLVDVGKVPLFVHLHGAVMLAWLGLAVVQSTLVQRDNLALHRKLGWLGIALAALVVILGSYVGIRAVETGRQPPFFTPPYFLALTQVGVLCFGGLVAAAVVRRRQTEWHRRLMVSAMILIMEPGLGRVLPMPFIMPWGEWLALAVQLAVFALLVRHDQRRRGGVHPATLVGIGVTVFAHVAVELLAVTPAVAALAQGLAPA